MLILGGSDPPMQQKLENYLEQVLKAGLFAVLFVPLVVTSFTIFPYVFGKATVFGLIIQILFAGYLLLIFINPEPGRRVNRSYLPRFSILLLAVGVWIAVLILSTLTSVNPYHSFWSTIERREGLLLFLHLAVFFVLLAGLMRKRTDWERLFQISLLVSLIVTLYILLQLLPFRLPFIAPPQSLVQPSGPLGNPVFVGSYLLFHIFIALFLFLGSKEKRRRIIYGFICAFQLSVVLFLVNVRSASLGVLSGLFICFALSVFSRFNARTRFWFTVGTIIMFIVLGGLFVSGTKGGLGDDFFLNRFFNLKINFDAPGASGRLRFLEWHAAFQGIKEKPVLGWGLENFAVIYDKYFPPEHPYYFVNEHASGVDRAHSLYFDWASTTGILGLLSLLLLIGAAVVILWNKFRKAEKRSQIIFFVLAGLFGGYLVEGIFIFDTLNSYIPFFLVLGFIHFLGREKEEAIPERLTGGMKNGTIFGALIIILAGLLAGIIYFVDMRPLRAVMFARQAFVEFGREGKVEDSLALLQKSFSLNSFINDEIRLNFANMLEPGNKEYFERAFLLAEAGLQEGIARNPLEVKFYLNLGHLYNKAFFVFGSEEYLEKAEEILARALKLSPTRQELYYEFGATEMFKKDFDNAEGLFKKALDLDPRFPKAWWFLGISQIAAGKDDARHTIDEAMRLSDTYPPIGQVFLLPESGWLLLVNQRIGYSSDTLRYFEGLLELYPESERLHAVLAGFYAAEGEFNKAEETAKKVLMINPDLEKDVDRFLEYTKRLRGARDGNIKE